MIGKRRAEVVAQDKNCRLSMVIDPNEEIARELASSLGCRYGISWHRELATLNPAIVIVSTPNGFLAEIANYALQLGAHVLIEKPMGRNLVEACVLNAAARAAQRKLKVGFNHRYHPAIRMAHEYYCRGDIGNIVNLRAVYGHGGRPGYENEWRGNAELAGGGELTDQGVHLIDLFNWFLGTPSEVVGFMQSAVWPIQPLEDNAYAMFRYSTGAVATFHTSWTQWKNAFSLHIHGTLGSLKIEGLGRSYGVETLEIAKRNMTGGVPEAKVEQYELEDDSWSREWADFINGIENNAPFLGNSDESVAVMRVVDALYRSQAQGTVIFDHLKPAVFLDRDGVINEVVFRAGKPASPRTLDEFKWTAGVQEAVKTIKDAGYLVLVVTNQPDISRGKMTQENLNTMNNLIEDGLNVDDIYACVCDDGPNCTCRKPKPGMIHALAQRHGVDLRKSYIIGDSEKDIVAGTAAGVRTILIDTEYNQGVSADTHVAGLPQAVLMILEAESLMENKQ